MANKTTFDWSGMFGDTDLAERITRLFSSDIFEALPELSDEQKLKAANKARRMSWLPVTEAAMSGSWADAGKALASRRTARDEIERVELEREQAELDKKWDRKAKKLGLEEDIRKSRADVLKDFNDVIEKDKLKRSILDNKGAIEQQIADVESQLEHAKDNGLIRQEDIPVVQAHITRMRTLSKIGDPATYLSVMGEIPKVAELLGKGVGDAREMQNELAKILAHQPGAIGQTEDGEYYVDPKLAEKRVRDERAHDVNLANINGSFRLQGSIDDPQTLGRLEGSLSVIGSGLEGLLKNVTPANANAGQPLPLADLTQLGLVYGARGVRELGLFMLDLNDNYPGYGPERVKALQDAYVAVEREVEKTKTVSAGAAQNLVTQINRFNSWRNSSRNAK